ncbi:MAG: SDR family oxidoreductase [Mycobacteriaceae bacterium]
MGIVSFSGKKCVLTGAASGIGRATALELAQQGACLLLTDINDVGLAKTVKDVEVAGGFVGYSEAFDLCSFEAVQSFGDKITETFGTVDVVFNIAGISTWGPVEKLEHSHWKKMIDVNLMGPIHIIETFVPAMVQAGRGGHLVNVSSAAGLFGLPWHAAYSAAKFGLRGISEVLKFDLARYNIGVSLVCPGAVDTPLVNTVEIVGIDRNSKHTQKLVKHFQKKAVSPEKVARSMIKGTLKNRYLIFTSSDIRIGFWFQQKFAFPYNLSMKSLNNQLHSVMVKSLEENS